MSDPWLLLSLFQVVSHHHQQEGPVLLLVNKPFFTPNSAFSHTAVEPAHFLNTYWPCLLVRQRDEGQAEIKPTAHGLLSIDSPAVVSSDWPRAMRQRKQTATFRFLLPLLHSLKGNCCKTVMVAKQAFWPTQWYQTRSAYDIITCPGVAKSLSATWSSLVARQHCWWPGNFQFNLFR